MADELIVVELPVCDVCGYVGRMPVDGRKAMKGYCIGLLGKHHRKVRMKPRLFREVVPPPRDDG